MSAHLAAMLAGLFLAPLAALALGHRLNRRPRRQRLTFWGLIVGHTIAALLATAAALYLPVRWDGSDIVRGLLGFWSLLIGGAVGAAVGWVLGGREAEGERR